MAFRVAAAAFFLCLLFSNVRSKIYDRCELAYELREVYNIPEHQLATWLCIANYESHFNTSAHNPGSGDHGLFQISELFWCSPPGVGLSCGLPCAALKDDDIEDDVICAKRIYRQHQRISGDGFTAWVVYNLYCRDKLHVNSFLSGCFDYENSIKYGLQGAAMNLPTMMVPMPTSPSVPSSSSSAMLSPSPSPSAVPMGPPKPTPGKISGKPTMTTPKSAMKVTSGQPSSSLTPSKSTTGKAAMKAMTSAATKPPMQVPSGKPSSQTSSSSHSPSPSAAPMGPPKPPPGKISGKPTMTTPKSAMKVTSGQPSSSLTPSKSTTGKAAIKAMTSAATKPPMQVPSGKPSPQKMATVGQASPKPSMPMISPQPTSKPMKIAQMSTSSTPKPAKASAYTPAVQFSSITSGKPSMSPSSTSKPAAKVSTYTPAAHFSSVVTGKSSMPSSKSKPTSSAVSVTTPRPSIGVSTYKPTQMKQVPTFKTSIAASVTPSSQPMVEVSSYNPILDDHPSQSPKLRTTLTPSVVSITPKASRTSTNRPSASQTKHKSSPVTTPRPRMRVSTYQPLANRFGSSFEAFPKANPNSLTPGRFSSSRFTTQRPTTRHKYQTFVTKSQSSAMYSSRGQRFPSTSKSPITSFHQTSSKHLTQFSSSSTTRKPSPFNYKSNPVKPRQSNYQFKFRPDEKVYAVINDGGYSYAISSRGFKLVWTGQ